MPSDSALRVLRYIDRVVAQRLVRMGDVRPEILESLPGFDLLGRTQPRGMGGLTYANLCAEVGVGFKQVPGDFWTLTTTADGFPLAEVACQCGETPSPEPLAPMVECACHRWFFFDGENVWAFNSTPNGPVVSDDNETPVPT